MYPNCQVPNDSFISNVHLGSVAYCYQSVIVIKLAWPKVIPLSGACCILCFLYEIQLADLISLQSATIPGQKVSITFVLYYLNEWEMKAIAILVFDVYGF
jgi:hypothetical protein